MKLEIRHLPEVQAAMQKRGAAINPALIKAASRARQLLVPALSAYPSAPAGSRYQRTGRLGRGWQRATPLNGGTGFQLINPTEYAGLVQGTNQAWMHKGRWKTAEQIAHELLEDILAAYEDAVKEAIQ